MEKKKFQSLEEISQGRNNNLNFIRLIAAIMVIFSHSFPISGGVEIDPFTLLTDGQVGLGALAVDIFFFYGGFLICKSVCRLKTFRAYFRARILRIFPPLFMICAILTFFVGAVLTELTVTQYFTDAGTYKYLLNSFLILQRDLPGVFIHNIYGSVVNGSLWTLPVEFICYIMCYVIYKFDWLKDQNIKWLTAFFIVGCLGIRILSGWVPVLSAVITPISLFYEGILCFKYRNKIKLNLSVCMMMLFGMITSVAIGVAQYTVFMFLPYILLYIGYVSKYKFFRFANKAEISYGMYLCAFPVQQIVCHLWGGKMNPYMNFLVSMPVIVMLGWICYRIVEKPMARWMKK